MDNDELTHFPIACLKNMENVVVELLEKGVNVDESVSTRVSAFSCYTFLHIAVEHQNIKIIDLLLKYGADVNAINNEGSTPLHVTFSPCSVNKDILLKLLKNKANPNVRNNSGNTIIEMAIERNLPKILEIILEYGADPNLANPMHQNLRPLQLAIKCLNEKMVNILLKYGADATFNYDGNTIVHWIILNVKADENYYEKIFRRLVEYNCNLDFHSGLQLPALHLSYVNKVPDCLRALLNSGADINIEDYKGRSVIWYFQNYVSSEMVNERYKLYWTFRRKLELYKFIDAKLSRMNEMLYDWLLETKEEFFESDYYIKENIEEIFAIEFQRMKIFKLSSHTLYNMIKDVNKMSRYLVGNDVLPDSLINKQLNELFPMSRSYIMLRYRMALKRKNLLRPAIDAISRLANTKCNWNVDCSKTIVEYLNDEDLLVLEML